MASKLIVTTDVGTFTRTTARNYSHIVVVRHLKAGYLEARRSSLRSSVDFCKDAAPGSRDAKHLLDAQTALDSLDADDATWGVIGWCGRLDLAQKLLNKREDYFASPKRYREVRIYAVADGAQVL